MSIFQAKPQWHSNLESKIVHIPTIPADHSQ